MKINPLYDRVLVERTSAETRTKGGIIIPDTAGEKPQRGIVVAKGRGRIAENGDLAPLKVKKGDKVIFGKYAGTEISFDGKEYVMLREDELLAILND